jgi:hypothetical protein
MSREDAGALSLGASLRGLISLNVLTVGRRLLAMRQVLVVGQQRGEPAPLLTSVQELIAYDSVLVNRERLWRQQRNETTRRPGAQKIDYALDRQLNVVFTTTGQLIEGLDPEQDKALIARGQALLSENFPSGVGAITRLPFDDELEVVRDIVSSLEGEQWADVVSDLGLQRQVARLRALMEAYAEALLGLPQALIEFKALRAERWLGHELMLGVVAQVLGLYHAPDPASVASREALLLPVRVQDQRVSEYLKRRRRVSDVDPDTGEEIEPDELSAPLDLEDGAEG